MSSSAVDLDQRTRTLPLWQLMVLVILVLSFFGHSYWLATIESDRTDHLTETDKVRIKAQQLAQYAKQASSGDVDAFDELITDRRIIDDTVRALRDGNDQYPSLPTDVLPRFNALTEKWSNMNTNALTIINQRDRIEEVD